ncbi:MAG: hypothetical protein OXF07_10710 [Rhodobacter sp.]|nr:hypothetical protein [Rhodobacter sp.]
MATKVPWLDGRARSFPSRLGMEFDGLEDIFPPNEHRRALAVGLVQEVLKPAPVEVAPV